MPSYTRGKKRDNLIFVAVSEMVYFGFKSKDFSAMAGISASDLTLIGHTPLSSATGFKIIGARAPQPPRVKRPIPNAGIGQQRSINTYCAFDKLGDAIGAGWTVTKRKRPIAVKAPSTSRGTMTAIATLSDLSGYCFALNKADFDEYGSELGLKSTLSITNQLERDRLVSGSSIPYPGRAVKSLAGGNSFSTFFSTSTDVLAAGYAILSNEKVLLDGAPF